MLGFFIEVHGYTVLMNSSINFGYLKWLKKKKKTHTRPKKKTCTNGQQMKYQFHKLKWRCSVELSSTH